MTSFVFEFSFSVPTPFEKSELSKLEKESEVELESEFLKRSLSAFLIAAGLRYERITLFPIFSECLYEGSSTTVCSTTCGFLMECTTKSTNALAVMKARIRDKTSDLNMT